MSDMQYRELPHGGEKISAPYTNRISPCSLRISMRNNSLIAGPNDPGSPFGIGSELGAALWGAPRLMAYVASKGAVIAMTRSMARELGEKRIRINAIAPGLTRVEATEYVPAERHQLYENGRALSGAQQPEDVTGSVVWLLSDLSRFITGQLIPVNGGFVFN